MINKLFIDVGVGGIDAKVKEAWGREKEFTIIGIEPSTTRYNSLKNIYPGQLLNRVVTDKDGEIDCWEDPESGILLFMREDIENKNFKRVKKKAIKLDSLDWKSFNEIHIWADIEGAELLMLKGATEMLVSGKVKWINLEVRKNAPSKGWATANQVYEFLDKYGFKPEILLTQLHEKRHRDVVFMPLAFFNERQ